MSTSEETNRDWAYMPSDIIYIISSKLRNREYVSFGKICTTWRAGRAPLRMPCLLYFPNPNDNSEQSKQLLLSTDISNVDNISNSDLDNPYPQREWLCIGSQDGWLITVVVYSVAANPLTDFFTAVEKHVILVNPLTGQQIELPSIDFHECNIIKAVIIWSCQTDDASTVVLLINSEYTPIAFAQTTRNRWSTKRKCNHPRFVDVCCIDGKLYSMDRKGTVYAIKFNNSSYGATEFIMSFSYYLEAKDRFMFTNAKYCDSTSAKGRHIFMVKFGRDILCIEAHCSDDNLIKLAIIKLDMKKQMWVAMKDLGGCSLFVGELCSISVSAEPKNIRRKGNVIHFQYLSTWTSGNEYTIGLFDMEDGSYKTNKVSDPQLLKARSVWFA